MVSYSFFMRSAVRLRKIEQKQIQKSLKPLGLSDIYIYIYRNGSLCGTGRPLLYFLDAIAFTSQSMLSVRPSPVRALFETRNHL